METRPTDGDARPIATDAPPYQGLSIGMEQHLYRLLGRLLGTLETMATSVDEDAFEGRQRTWLQEALDSGHDLKEHIEALAFLATPDPEQRLDRAPYSVRRMVEHAVRAAGWLASERGVSLVLPRLEGWAEREVNVDVRAVDRVIRGLSELMIGCVKRRSAVEVSLSESDHVLCVRMDARGESVAELPVPSELLLSAWQCIAALHHGRVWLSIEQKSAVLWLPLCET